MASSEKPSRSRRRESKAEAAAAEPVTPPRARACSERGCKGENVVACSYVDAQGAQCGTWWCPAHIVVFFERSVCTRHASALAAVGENPQTLPAVGDRAASLAHWIASDLDEVIRGILDRARDQYEESMLTAPVTAAATKGGRTTWERSWWLQGEHGLSIRVTIAADTQGDPEVVALIDDEVVDRSVPPWIAHRLHGEEVSPTEDLEERRAFERRLADAIALGVERRRPSRGDLTLHASRPAQIPPPVT